MEFEIIAHYRMVIAGEQEKEFDYHCIIAKTLEQAAKIVASKYGTAKRLYKMYHNDVEIDKNLYL